jgi:hypothetical protein
LVGSRDDTQVIALNQKALQQLSLPKKKGLLIVPGAVQMFGEPGTFEEAAKQAASWFD